MFDVRDWIAFAQAISGPNGIVLICVAIIAGLLWLVRRFLGLWQQSMETRLADKEAVIARYKAITDQLVGQFDTTVQVMEGQRELLERLVDRRAPAKAGPRNVDQPRRRISE